VVGAVAYWVTAHTGFSASTFVGLARPSDNGAFYLLDTQPFATTMIYRWEVEPGNYFSVDTLGETDWTIGAGLGLDEEWVWLPPVMTVLDLTISLENETGNLTFARTENINAPWPDENGIPVAITITGAGTFTAISFTLNFDNVDPSFIGRPVVSEQGGYWPSMLSIGGSSGGAVVVPEPSIGALMVFGIGGVIALRRCRRSVV
jgi:hypothetical protein